MGNICMKKNGVLVDMTLCVGCHERTFQEKIRNNKQDLFFAALFIVLGFILNTLNLSITLIARSFGLEYFPIWIEISLSMMMVGIGFVLFRIAAEYLNIIPQSNDGHESHRGWQIKIISFTVDVPECTEKRQ